MASFILAAMIPRDAPYVWATWIAKVMAGEAACLWSYWFRAHYQYTKLPSTFDLARWTADHTALVQKTAERLRAEGHEVTLEAENAFNLRNKAGITLGAKPDIIARKDGEAVVWDAKTGKPKHSDAIQVWTYLACLPYTNVWTGARPTKGYVVYADGTTTEVVHQGPGDPLSAQFRERMTQLGGSEPLAKAPSLGECQFCDIPKSECPERIEKPTQQASLTDLF